MSSSISGCDVNKRPYGIDAVPLKINPKTTMKTRHSKRSRAQLNNKQAKTNTTTSPKKQRRSQRGLAALQELAAHILADERVLIITGAGLSVPSGVRPFRSTSSCTRRSSPFGLMEASKALWDDVVWSTATRRAFLDDPVAWYNDFWIPHFSPLNNDGKRAVYCPNAGHEALETLQRYFSNITQITQNIDGLQAPHLRLIEAHGRMGLYKCVGEEEKDNDDDDDERSVQLGRIRRRTRPCPYQYRKSLRASQLEPRAARDALLTLNEPLPCPPVCPHCDSLVLPQALLFDEPYHSHQHYQFERMEEWIRQAEVVVFCGTSWSVRLTQVCLERCRNQGLLIYNLNLHDTLRATSQLHACNIIGSTEDLLPALVDLCLAENQDKNDEASA